MATVVSIGRNVTTEGVSSGIEGRFTEPMPEQDWQRFIGAVQDLPRTIGLEVYFEGEGEGTFEGRYEESFTIVFEDVDGLDHAALVASLAALAAEYDQESIALTTGETEFIAADSGR